MTITVPNNAAADICNRRRHDVCVNNNNAMAQPTHKYNGLTRNQHAMPSNTPAPSASHTLLRFAASSRTHAPPSTNHVAGASADGYAPYIANSAENANT